MTTAIIIPARYGSSRLKGKPLIEVAGKPIIQWVFEKAVKSKLADRVIIATDHEEILNTCLMFGAEAEMTSIHHNCGSDRIQEVLSRHPEINYVVNLQGDEPLITSDSIDEVKAIAKLGPNILVAEPTELIGTGKPADKEYVDEVIKVIREINPDIKPFPSAGITKGQDCYNIIKAGASASGCSSAIAKAENPLALAEEMIAAVRKAFDERQGK